MIPTVWGVFIVLWMMMSCVRITAYHVQHARRPLSTALFMAKSNLKSPSPSSKRWESKEQPSKVQGEVLDVVKLDGLERLQKVIARSGIASRRQSESLVSLIAYSFRVAKVIIAVCSCRF